MNPITPDLNSESPGPSLAGLAKLPSVSWRVEEIHFPPPSRRRTLRPRAASGPRQLPHIHPAIHIQHMPSNVSRLIARQEYNRRRNIRVSPSPPKRNPPHHKILHVLRQRLRHRRSDKSRRNSIHGNTSRRDFHSNSPRQPDQSGLRRNVIRL